MAGIGEPPLVPVLLGETFLEWRLDSWDLSNQYHATPTIATF